MRYLRYQMLKNVLLVCVIFSTLSGCTTFDWEARPWAADPKAEQIVNPDGITIKCDQEIFKEYTCFHADNMAELRTAIQRSNTKRRTKRKLLQIFKTTKKAELR